MTTLAGSLIGSSPAAADPLDKVEGKVRQQVAGGEQATFWAMLGEKADLGKAPGVKDWTARGQVVINQLQQVADESQAGLRGLLRRLGAKHQPFWIVNAIRITGNDSVLRQVAAQPGVERIVASRTYRIPESVQATDQAAVAGVEWNIDRIRAPEVWSTFGDRGEGIVVANIDSGVQFDHPALVRQYRGNLGDGSFDHNYNWFDPAMICGSPSSAPCDNIGHGTHTIGTVVGGDGEPGENQIGVAPHARWITAKGCETNLCSDLALLNSAEWLLAPTDLNRQNPRPDLRPHIVNNSWASNPGGNPYFQDVVRAWVAAGIFPVFSNGNIGEFGCSTTLSPADYVESYGVGAFDVDNTIAHFSSRGPSLFGGEELKPNIAAPGVSVRSSIPASSYDSYDGTSMAAPHVAGTVALMWSAAPALVGDVGNTRTLLDETAIDVSDLSCGGTAADNNVWGEGRLDAYTAVERSPRGPAGTLAGTVTDATSGSPIQAATIRIAGSIERVATSDANGQYRMILPIGQYGLTATAFGFNPRSVGVVVTEGATTVQDFRLEPLPVHEVSGHVRSPAGNPLPGATVAVPGTPISPARTDANGFYRLPAVPEGEYEVRATAGKCSEPETKHVVVDGDETLDFAPGWRQDAFGYYCELSAPDYIEANTILPLTGEFSSGNYTQIGLPFPFTFYGQTYNSATVATNGLLTFHIPNGNSTNESIPSPNNPNGAIYPFWDDLTVDRLASVRTQALGSPPNRRFVIEWRNVLCICGAFTTERRIDFEVVLSENGRIQTEYRNIGDDARERGRSATIGIENENGDVALQYSFEEAVLDSPAFAVRYLLPPNGYVQGMLTNANDNLAVLGAEVRALQDGSVVRSVMTNASGFYRLQLSPGAYTIQATATNYGTTSVPVAVSRDGDIVAQDFALRTARGVATPTSLQFTAQRNKKRVQALKLENTGSLDMDWRVLEGRGADPNAAGRVIRSWAAAGIDGQAYGIGYTGNVWISDQQFDPNYNHEYSVSGVPTGRRWLAPWAGFGPFDMAYDSGRGLMCQVHALNGNGIHCWNPDTGEVVDSINDRFPWSAYPQRGLAYRPDDDTFYVGGTGDRVLYHVKGLSYPDKGAIISECQPPYGAEFLEFPLSGLAWNPAYNTVWAMSENSQTNTAYQLDPETCAVLSTVPLPYSGFGGAGLDMDPAGNLWMLDQLVADWDLHTYNVFLVESGVPSFGDVPWLSALPAKGTLAAGDARGIAVTVNTTGLAPGVYRATLFIETSSGRKRTLPVSVTLTVQA
jgi:hypothetical protein